MPGTRNMLVRMPLLPTPPPPSLVLKKKLLTFNWEFAPTLSGPPTLAFWTQTATRPVIHAPQATVGVTVRGEAGRLAGWVACRRGCPWSQAGPSPPDLEGPEASHSSYTNPQKVISPLPGEPQP